MDRTKQRRRGDTRQRIQDVALELFAEQGYEKTSLREIAERLDVTKAALYYHFKTKEEIVVSLFEDLTKPIEDLIEWGRQQPHTLAMKQEIVRRYSEALTEAAPLFRFMQENQATVRDLSIGDMFKTRMLGMREIIIDPDAPWSTRSAASARCSLCTPGCSCSMTSRATRTRSARRSWRSRSAW